MQVLPLEEELIRDQLAEHTNDSKLREKPLTMPDDLSLSKAVDIAFQLESAAALATQLAPTHTPPSPKPDLIAQTVVPALEAPESVFSEDNLQVNFAACPRATTRRVCGNCG